MKMKKQTTTRILAMLLCLVMLFLAGCAAAPAKPAAEETATTSEGGEKYADTLNIEVGAINYTSPFETDNGNHARLYLCSHSRLTEKDLDNDSAIIPGLAESWEWVEENVIDFKLREGVKFHNGETLTADDVVFTFETACAGNSASKLTAIEKVEAVDDLTVRFTLVSHNEDFPAIVSETFCSICNRKACEADEVNGPSIGTGSYKITEFIPADHVVLERFDDYFGEAPKTRCLNFVNIPEASTALIALQNGEINFMEPSSDEIGYAMDDKNLETREEPLNTVYYLAFNTSKGVTADENLRLAIAHCVDLDEIVALLDDGSDKAYTQWGPATYGFDASIEGYEYDLDLAKEYLAKAFPDGNAKITLTNVSDPKAELIQAQCARIGLEVELQQVEAAALTAMTKFTVAEHEMMLGTTGWNLYGDDCRRVYYAGSNVNKSVITDQEIMDLIDAAVAETDDAARQEMYHQVQQINHEKCYVLPLAVAKTYYAYTKGLQGFKTAPNSRNDYSHAYLVVE